MFSDEAKRELFDRGRRHQVMVVNDESILAGSRLKLKSNRTDSVTLYKCINCRGFVSTELTDGTLNAGAYIDILDRRVASKLQSRQVRETWTYQHDNEPAHTAKRVSITKIRFEPIVSVSRLVTIAFECVAPRQVEEYLRSEYIKVLDPPAQ